MTETFYATFCVECDKRIHCLIAGGCIRHDQSPPLRGWPAVRIGQRIGDVFTWFIHPYDLDKLPPTMKIIFDEEMKWRQPSYTVAEFKEQVTGKCAEHIHKFRGTT